MSEAGWNISVWKISMITLTRTEECPRREIIIRYFDGHTCVCTDTVHLDSRCIHFLLPKEREGQLSLQTDMIF
jgi:hypothetical protein